MMFDGLVTTVKPGSLWDPEDTNLWPSSWTSIGLTLGLTVVLLDAHAVFPSIYKEMKKPSEFPKVIDRTYSLISFLYISFSSIGYLMFGALVMPEITQNFPLVPTFNPFLTQLVLFLTALNPLTKYALVMNPVNLFIESSAGIRSNVSPFQRIVSRSFTSLIVLGLSILVPSFYRLMGLLGSCFSFTVAVIFPCLCYLKLFKGSLDLTEIVTTWFIIIFGIICAVWGTWAALQPGI